MLRCPTPRLLCAVWLLAAAGIGAAAEYVDVRGGSFRSVVAGDASDGLAKVDDFSIRITPVTRGEYLRFVEAHPQWRRGRVAAMFADAGYLSDWPSAEHLSADDALRPVTQVSWFAAQAYCEDEDARLPTWNEWELVAAAGATRTDAR